MSNEVFYYNVIMNGTGINKATIATYDDTRTQAILNNAGDYMMSIVSFSIDSSHMPLFVCDVIQNPNNHNDINFTPYVITMRFNETDYSENLIYNTDKKYLQLPVPPTPENGQDTNTEYYYVYYYDTFITMMNEAIKRIYARISNDYPPLQGKSLPYFEYNIKDGLISLLTPNIEYTTGSGVYVYRTQLDPINGQVILTPQTFGTIQIYVNSRLYRFIDGIPSYISNYGQSQSVYNQFCLLVKDLGNNYYYKALTTDLMLLNTAGQAIVANTQPPLTYTTSPNYLRSEQEYPNIGGFNSLASIIFMTSHIPIQNEYIPSLKDLGGSSSSRPIVTSFSPNLQKAGESRTRFTYYPSGAYRLINLKSSQPLNRIDLQVFWQDKNQNLYPFKISYGETNTIKIMFIKKSFLYSSNNNMMLKY